MLIRNAMMKHERSCVTLRHMKFLKFTESSCYNPSCKLGNQYISPYCFIDIPALKPRVVTANKTHLALAILNFHFGYR